MTQVPIADNLSARARADLTRLLAESARTFGRSRAAETRFSILSRCRDIAEGRGLGHVRTDAPKRKAFRFWPVPPFVIVYDLRTKLVVRILHGRRDIPSVLR